MHIHILIRSLVCAAWILALSTQAIPASQEEAAPASASIVDIEISFKLDTRTTQALYMGERWVSPPAYSGAQTGKVFIVQAKAEGVDARGRVTDISPTWTVDDPEMVEVSPAQSHQVEITVRRVGQSSLNVEFKGFSKKLAVKAVIKDDVIQVQISQ